MLNMVLYNFAKILSAWMGTTGEGSATLKNYSGEDESRSVLYLRQALVTAGDKSSTYCAYIQPGTGDTAVAGTDYCLASATDALTHVSSNVAQGANANLRTYTETYINNTESPITVKEIGLTLKYMAANFYLMTRKVLATPITIAPGESYAFSVNLSINGEEA